ncbi:MAG: putative O-linked N-acetylglucosamine transferase, SPINDLY family [Candidatus Nitrotoga sp. SPKER]|nr:MAG: putative O-linked N-acetylglucosamine transferase, SPINDLY family [Candidatus Nitrotoga sp. SPKER]
MTDSADLLNLAEALQQAAALARKTGNLEQALAYLDQAIALSPQESRYHFLRGLTLEDLHRPDEAIASLQNAIRVKPDYAEACNNIGIILHDQKRFAQAAANFRDAIHYKPDYPEAYNNLGTSLRALGDLAGAQQQFAQAVLLKPDYALAHYNQGITHLDMGQLNLAETSFRHALRLKPDHVQACNYLGSVQHQLGKLDEAEASFTHAAQMKPGKNGAELNKLARVFWEQGRIEQTLAAYRQAQMLNPHELKSALGALLSLPAVYRNQIDLLEARQRFANGLKILHANIPNFISHNQPEKLLDELRWSNFYLAYQGLDDKSLQTDYAQFIAAMLEKIAPQFMHPRVKKDTAGRRLRIGYLSSFFRNCTVGMYFRSWITRLDREQFEIFVYHTRSETDPVTQEIIDACDHFRHLVAGIISSGSIANTVLADDLDVLVYPELGMDNTSFLLAAMRLAPVQCAGWGHPVTSGHKNIDYYFSSAAMEPDNAKLHYSEKLILIEGLGTYYSKPALPTPARRADFALPEGKTLYLCPQSLFKIHPDNDALLANILERDPDGVIVMFAGRHPNITNTFFSRLVQALSARGLESQGRGIILPSMAHDDYLRVNMLCDVMLDTLHWSGGNTTLDALACGLPVVTLPGEFMRGRQSYGMLKCMGLDELIAKDQDDYIEIAIKIATDSKWCQQVVQRIITSSNSIFNMGKSLRQMESFYHSVFNVPCDGQ